MNTPKPEQESRSASVAQIDRDTIKAMRSYGGSFVQALAEAAVRADETNLERIKTAFPEYWLQYQAMGQKIPVCDSCGKPNANHEFSNMCDSCRTAFHSHAEQERERTQRENDKFWKERPQ